MLRAILFDFDGVIVDTEPLHWAAMNEVLALHAMPQVPKKDYYENMLGLDDRGLFRDSFARAGQPLPAGLLDALITEKSARFLAMAGRESIVLPGAAELIASVASRHLLAICSGALRREIETILRAAGLLSHFSVIVGADDVQRGKPDPQGYLLALQRLQDKHRLAPPLQPAECLVIEDSMPGIEAGKDAGMTCLAVSTSVQGELLLQADAIVGTLREVSPALLDALFNGGAS
jgi:HAD superfamily hydrolase (TIGR01509 family)